MPRAVPKANRNKVAELAIRYLRGRARMRQENSARPRARVQAAARRRPAAPTPAVGQQPRRRADAILEQAPEIIRRVAEERARREGATAAAAGAAAGAVAAGAQREAARQVEAARAGAEVERRHREAVRQMEEANRPTGVARAPQSRDERREPPGASPPRPTARRRRRRRGPRSRPGAHGVGRRGRGGADAGRTTLRRASSGAGGAPGGVG